VLCWECWWNWWKYSINFSYSYVLFRLICHLHLSQMLKVCILQAPNMLDDDVS
jgi:hypothetical protein